MIPHVVGIVEKSRCYKFPLSRIVQISNTNSFAQSQGSHRFALSPSSTVKMEGLNTSPVRLLPAGVGLGAENSGSKHQSGGILEKSPYQRIPLSLVTENSRSALLSGVQRVLVKAKNQPENHVVSPPQRSPNNFMKPTESSRVNSSTPIRAHNLTRQTNTTAGTPLHGNSYHTAVPSGNSASIHQHVQQQTSFSQPNPLMTPTRAQSSGRAIQRSHPVTPPSQARNTPIAPTTIASSSASKRSTTPTSTHAAHNTVHSRSTIATVGSGTKVVRELSHSNNTTSASAQMLFSPDSAARLGRDQSPAYRTAVQQSTLTGCNTLTAGEIAAQQPRPISAPRLRPQSLSSQLQAHSDRLNASSSPPTAAVPIPVPVDGVMRPAGTVAPVPVRNVGFPTDALSPTPSARPVNVVTPPAVASPPSTHQQGTPGSGGGGSGGKTKPASHGHAHTHAPVSKPAVRSADVLSANKAAKLAALHAHTTSTNNGNSHATAGPAGSNGGGGAARYAQPTHSSAAATAALLVHQPTTTAGVAKAPRSRIPTSRAPTASHPSSSAGIAAASAADEGGGPTSTTPQRKMIRKLSTATATGIPMTRRREGAPTSHGAEKAPLAAEGKVFKSAKPSSSGVERKEVAAAVAKATKTSPVGGKRSVSGTGGTTKTRIPSSSSSSKGHAGESATTAGNASAASQSGTASGVAAISSSSSALCDSTLNADAIMQILQGGGASPDRVMRDNQNQESNFDQQQHHTAPTAARQAHQQAQLESAAHTSMLEKLRRSYSFGSELSCVVGEEVLTLGGSIDFSGNNTFDSEVTYMSAPFPSTTHSAPRASVMSFNSSATSTSAAATPTAAVNTAFVGVSRPAVTVGICTTPIAANNAVNKVAGPLRLQMLEESLADVSRVEDAPATFSPTNLSMLSNFSQGTFAGYADDAEFAPTPRNNSAVSAAAAVAPIPAQAKPSIISSVRVTANHQPAATTATTNATSLSQRLSRHAPTAATTCTAVGPVTTAATAGDSGKYSELSCIQKVASTTHLSDASGVNYSSARHGEDAWADEYSAFFPPDSTCANTSSSSTGGAAEPAEVASTLNFSATEDGSSLLDDASMLRVNLPDIRDTSASGRWLNSTSFAVSPLPQDMRRHQHQHRALTSDTAYSASSAVSATSGVSDVLNQAMMMSDANFSATGSVASRATSVFSLAVPATRLTRQGSDGSMNMNMNQQSQSFNISAISPADGGTITSIDASGMFRSNSYLSITDSRIQVGSSAHSFASSNVLDRAMLASYDEDFVLDLQRASASESTTGLSPYLHPQRGFSRSISDNMSNIITPKCDSYPMRTMFAPPPPPEVDVRPPMPAAVSATPAGLTGGDVDERDCTASQQFDRTIDAAFASEHDISDLGAPHFDSSTLAAATADAEVRASSRDWYARSSVESLPPPPPPLEAYPTDDAQLQLESVDNSAMFEESDFNMNTNSSAGGMFNSENDSVLQDTAEFDVVPSGSSSSKVSQSNVQNHSGEQSPVDAQSGNTTASSVLAPPTQLSGSVDYGSGGPETLTSNGYYNHLPMPAISSAPAVSNYLEIENRHPVGGSVGVSDGVDPDFDFKQHLLEESSRKFRELRSFTSSPMMMRAGPQLSPPTAATASGAPALSPGRESFQLRSSFPVDLPTIPSFGSMHSMSYVYSTDSADAGAGQRSPSRLGAVVRHGSSGSHGSTLSYAAATAEVAAVDTSHQSNLHDQQEVSQQYLEELGVDEVEEGDDGDDSQEELDEISEVYDDYLPDHLPLSMSMMSGNSRFTSASRMITQSTNQSMTSSNSNMSCSYTSSVEELHQLNPACKTGSWVQENYLSPHQQQQEGRSAREPQHFSPSGNFGMFSGSQEGSGIAQKHRADDSWEGLMHFQQQQQQQQQSFNPMPPRSRGSLIVREECGNSHAHSALLNADLICPDPIARQLLEEDGNSSSSPEKAKFSDWRHVFVPVSDAYEV